MFNRSKSSLDFDANPEPHNPSTSPTVDPNITVGPVRSGRPVMRTSSRWVKEKIFDAIIKFVIELQNGGKPGARVGDRNLFEAALKPNISN